MIAMGAEYERLAAATILRSRRNTSLPIAVILNTDNPAGGWGKLPGVKRIVVACDTDNNRSIKTQLHKYTPYDQTLYMDVDAVIQKAGIERIFEGLKKAHIVLQRHTRWEPGRKYYEIYRRAAERFDAHQPLDIFIGGFFAFANTPDVSALFDLWNEYWKDFGAGRDMPPLACAVQNSGINYETITKAKDGLFSFGISDCVAVHRVHKDDLKKHFDLPEHKPNKPFDSSRGDWAMVNFDGKKNEWLERKVDTQAADKRERKYIENYLPEIRAGGLRVLDIGCGFGQFILCCRRYKNEVLGIVPPLEPYMSKKGIKNSDSLDYEYYARERMEKNKLPFVECDVAAAVDLGRFPVNGQFDVINCKHALALIFRSHFNFGGDFSQYKNDGEWIIDDKFRATFRAFFIILKSLLTPHGYVQLSALHAQNMAEYNEAIVPIAAACGFKMHIYSNPLVARLSHVR